MAANDEAACDSIVFKPLHFDPHTVTPIPLLFSSHLLPRGLHTLLQQQDIG